MIRKTSLTAIIIIGVLMSYAGCDDGGGVADVEEDGETVPAPVPQTGQTTCWNSRGDVIDCALAPGQDGDIRAGVVSPDPRFTDNGDGTITDNLTGLIWLKNANCFGQRNWEQALADANALADPQCGLSDGSVRGDWYLPNRNELTSLLDFENFNPALPPGHPFLNFQSSFYWSSTTYAFSPAFAWDVNIAGQGPLGMRKVEGKFVTAIRGVDPALAEPPAPIPQTGQRRCWNSNGNEINCAGTGQDGDIRAGVVPPDPRFRDNGDGTITDNLTGLIWLKDWNCFPPAPWEAALFNVHFVLKNGNCGLTDGSQIRDWRLPNRNELRSLLALQNFNPALPPARPFINVRVGGLRDSYWSSTTVAQTADRAWAVQISDGSWVGPRKTEDRPVTAVRDPF